MKKRILSWVLVLAMVLTLLPAIPAFADVTRYPLFVQGVQVTSANCTNVLEGASKATVSFDPATLTLTLDGALIQISDADAIVNGIPGLTIYVKSYSSVNGWRHNDLSSHPSGIVSTADLTITGPGRLRTRGDFGCGIWLTNGASLQIRDAFVHTFGTNGGIVAHKSGSQLVISNSMVFAQKNRANGAIVNFSRGIVFYDVGITDPIGGVVGGGSIKDAKGNIASTALIQPTTPSNPYDLWVGGVRVNGRNRDNILGDGVASYDNETKTLTFKDMGNQWYNWGGYDTVRNEIPGLTIRFIKACYLSGGGWNDGVGASAIHSRADLTLTGATFWPGNCAYAVKMLDGSTLTIDNVNVNNYIIGDTYYGICGNNSGEKLVIRGSNVSLQTEKDAIAYFNGGITLQNCTLKTPENGRIQGGAIVDNAGAVANKVSITREEYDLWIKDTQVTGGNQDDVLGDGVFAYDPASNVLTVNGDCPVEDYVNVIKNKIKGLTVRVAKNAVFSSYQPVIYTFADMKITGPGKLTLRSRDHYGIYADGNLTLTIDGADLDAVGKFGGIRGSYNSGCKLAIRSSRVHAANGNPKEYESGAIEGFMGGITLEGCAFFTPAGATIDDGSIKNKSGKKAPELRIDVPEEYELYIAGTKVTTANAFDILGDGAFSYDPETNTLTVEDDGDVGNQYMIANRIPDLTVYVKWAVKLDSTFSTIHTTKDMRITGPGKLTLRSQNAAVYVQQGATVTIENARLDVSGGNYGIVGHGPDKLVIRESAVHAHGPDGAISGFAVLELFDCRLTSPSSDIARIEGGAVIDYDDQYVADVTIDQKYDLKIAGTQVTCANASDVRGDGVFSYDPAENVLTVSGDCSTVEHITVWNSIPDLTLYVAEDSRFTTSDNTIAADKNMTITGPGKLTLNSTQTNGITVYSGATVTIDHAVIETVGCDIGALSMGKNSLIVDTSEVHVDGNVEGFNSITVTGCQITTPNNAVIKNGSIYESNGTTLAESVDIDVLKYNLRVAGVRVTSANAPDILGDGNFIYDEAENKLTVEGYCERAEGIIIWNHIPGLTVYNRYARTLSTSDNVIATDADMTLTGPGKLTLESGTVNGIMVYDGATLNIENANLEISGNQGIYGRNHAGLNIRNSTIHAVGKNEAIAGFDKGITFFNCEINEPANAKIKDGTVVVAGGTPAKEVTIGAPEFTSYGIWVNGKPVSSSNAWDILGNGVFSYDVKTNTLHVKEDYEIESNSTLIRSENPGLTVTADKDVTLTSKKWAVIEADEDLTITGTYKLTLVNENEDFTALSVENGATVTIDRANVEIRGSYGISGYAPDEKEEKLIVKSSKVLIDVEKEAVSDLDGGMELENCEITQPAYASFTGGTLYNNNTGDPAKKVEIGNVTKYNLSIADIQVDAQNAPDVLRDGVFSYDPAKNVLTVNGNCSTVENITVWNNIPDLTIFVAGDSTFRTSDNTIATSKNITITGPGTLTLNSTQTSGILAYGKNETITIESARIKTIGCGIIGSFLGSNHRLIIKNSEVEVDGHITGFNNVTLTDCELITPADGVVTSDGIYEADGETLAEGVVIGDPRVPDLIDQGVLNPFVDVKDTDWFFEAVMWAVSQEPPITSGTDDTHFSPYMDCSRAQVVQFLYNAAGNPAPKSTANPFKDVNSTDWFYDAVLWAVENDITAGTDAAHFSPNKVCTRAEVVQFIWNTKGNTPPTSTVHPFKDVKSTDWFYEAVLWAVENEITSGTDATHFSPAMKCSRSQIVQFLYNARDLV